MRITIRSPDARRARELQEALKDKGLAAAAILGPQAPGDMSVADLCLLDSHALHWFNEEVERLRASTSPPLALVGVCNAMAPPKDHVGVDGWIDVSKSTELIQRQAAALVRAAEARAELEVRARVAKEQRIRVESLPDQDLRRILYIGAPDPFFLALEHQCNASETVLEAAFSSFTGFDRLHDERFDGVVLNAAPDPAIALSLCGALRRNARLHHTPTLMITAPGDDATAQSAIERGAAVIHDFTRDSDLSINWLNEAMRVMRAHSLVEEKLARLRRAARGPGDLMTPDFFTAHVKALAAYSHQRGRDFALAALRVLPAPGARDRNPEQWRREVEQIAALAGRMLRAHDSAALFDDDVIIAAIPGADLTKARATADRIAAVAECTAFAAGESDAGPIILAHSLVALAPGESGLGLLTRAQDAFATLEMRG